MAFTAQYNTNALLTLLNQSVAGGGPITITSVQVGSGFPVGADNPANFTGLKNLVQTLGAITSPSNLSGISSINATVLYQTTVRFQVSSQDAPSTYQWNEYGIFAKVGAGTPVLICYVTTAAATGDTITPSGTGIPIIKQNATIINYSLLATTTTSLTLVDTVNLHSSTHLDNGVDPLPLATTARTGSLRTLIGDIQHYLDGTGNWSPITPLIVNNTTLYVDPSYNNVTPNFSSIANAMAYLNGFQIANGVSISIIVNDAVYATAATLNIQHVNGQQIQIFAANNAPDVQFTGIGSITGSANNWSVVLTGASSMTNIKIGTYLNIWSINGNAASFILCGCYKVTAIAGTTATIKVTYGGSAFPAVSAVTSIVVSPLNVVLNMAKNQYVSVGSQGLLMLRGIAVVCAAAPDTALGLTGLAINGNSYLNKIGVNGFIPSAGWVTNGTYIGIAFSSGVGTAYKVCSSGNMVGIVGSSGAQWTTVWCAANCNSLRGIWLNNGTIGAAGDYVTPGGSADTWACGNGENGILDNGSSLLTASALWVAGAQVYGIFVSFYNGVNGMGWGLAIGEGSLSNAALNANTSGVGGCYVWSGNNASGDLIVGGLSVADMQVVGSRIFNQASGTLTAAGIINI
jgi:hypothetical protein